VKIRIDKYGHLQIERAGRWVEQMCKDTMALEEDGTHCGLGCGHWCPLFGEPEDYKECQIPRKTVCPTGECDECQHNKPAGQFIDICGDRRLCGTIEDMRREA
jgi:hypothetical protein